MTKHTMYDSASVDAMVKALQDSLGTESDAWKAKGVHLQHQIDALRDRVAALEAEQPTEPTDPTPEPEPPVQPSDVQIVRIDGPEVKLNSEPVIDRGRLCTQYHSSGRYDRSVRAEILRGGEEIELIVREKGGKRRDDIVPKTWAVLYGPDGPEQPVQNWSSSSGKLTLPENLAPGTYCLAIWCMDADKRLNPEHLQFVVPGGADPKGWLYISANSADYAYGKGGGIWAVKDWPDKGIAQPLKPRISQPWSDKRLGEDMWSQPMVKGSNDGAPCRTWVYDDDGNLVGISTRSEQRYYVGQNMSTWGFELKDGVRGEATHLGMIIDAYASNMLDDRKVSDLYALTIGGTLAKIKGDTGEVSKLAGWWNDTAVDGPGDLSYFYGDLTNKYTKPGERPWQEMWAVDFAPTVRALEDNGGERLDHEAVSIRAAVTDTHNGTVDRVEWPSDQCSPFAAPKVTTVYTGVEPWGVRFIDDKLYWTDRLAHSVMDRGEPLIDGSNFDPVYPADIRMGVGTRRFIGQSIRGGGSEVEREARRKQAIDEQVVPYPEFIQKHPTDLDIVLVSSAFTWMIYMVNKVTGEVSEYLDLIPGVDVNSMWASFWVSDGSCGPVGTIYLSTWSRDGRPYVFYPDGDHSVFYDRSRQGNRIGNSADFGAGPVHTSYNSCMIPCPDGSLWASGGYTGLFRYTPLQDGDDLRYSNSLRFGLDAIEMGFATYDFTNRRKTWGDYANHKASPSFMHGTAGEGWLRTTRDHEVFDLPEVQELVALYSSMMEKNDE